MLGGTLGVTSFFLATIYSALGSICWQASGGQLHASEVHTLKTVISRFYIGNAEFVIGMVPGLDEGRVPIEPQEGLYLKASTELKRIKNLCDLRGMVTVKSKDEALSLARLRSSRRTFYLVDQGLAGEVTSRSKITASLTFGDMPLLNEMKHYGVGMFGVCDSEFASRMKLHVPRVFFDSDTYHIERYVVDRSA